MTQKYCQSRLIHTTAGFSYVEVLIATLLIAITLVPALEALQGSIIGTGVHQSQSSQYFLMVDKIEYVLAEPYNNLEEAASASSDSTTATSYSDPIGTTNRRLVYLFGYDADNEDADDDPLTGVDDGLLWIRVEIENTNQFIESLSRR